MQLVKIDASVSQKTPEILRNHQERNSSSSEPPGGANLASTLVSGLLKTDFSLG